MTNQEKREEALHRAINPLGPLSNFPAIFHGFLAMGIPEQDIRPRENVFTYEAWRALGRHVRKGQHGVKVVTYVPMSKEVEVPKEDGTTEKKQKSWSRPRTVTVFHVSQTEPDNVPQATETAAA